MKINSLRKLDRNDYERIIIRFFEEEDGFHIDVANMNKCNTLRNDVSFSKNIRNLSDIEKVREVIKYFLRNTNINFIYENEHISRYEGLYLILGNDDRQLLFKNIPGIFDDKLKKECINKYVLDRNKFFNSSNIKNIEFVINDTIHDPVQYSYKYPDLTYEPYLCFNLKNIKGKMIDIDKKFLIDLITYLINNTDNEIYTDYIYSELNKKAERLYGTNKYLDSYSRDNVFFEKTYFSEKRGFHLYIGDYNVLIDDKIYNFLIKEKVLEHNKNVKKYKKLQLSLFD